MAAITPKRQLTRPPPGHVFTQNAGLAAGLWHAPAVRERETDDPAGFCASFGHRRDDDQLHVSIGTSEAARD